MRDRRSNRAIGLILPIVAALGNLACISLSSIRTATAETTIRTAAAGTNIRSAAAGTTIRTATAETTIRTAAAGTTIRTATAGKTIRTATAGTTIRTATAGTTIRTATAGTTIRTATAETTIRTAAAGTTIRTAAAGTTIRTAAAGTTIRTAAAGTTIRAPAGRPLVNLTNPQEPAFTYAGPADVVAALRAGWVNPTALAAADFDADGAMDVIAGYAVNRGGVLALFHGNRNAYAPKNRSLYEKAMRGSVPATFQSAVGVTAVPESPDLLATGDFNRDGRQDVLVGARGGALYLLAGDGHGHFREPREVPLPGQVVALAVTGDGHVAVSLESTAGPQLKILAPGPTGLTDGATFPMPARGDSVAVGNLGGGADVAVGAGGQVVMIYGALGAHPKTESVAVPFRVAALTVGDFIWDRDGRTELAVLADDGSIHLLKHGTLDTRALAPTDIPGRRAALMARSRRPPSPTSLGAWKVARQLPYAGLAPSGPVASAAFSSPRLAAAPTHDLMVLDAGQRQLTILDTSGPEANPRAAAFDREANPRVAAFDRAADPRAGVFDREANPRAAAFDRGANPRAAVFDPAANPSTAVSDRAANPSAAVSDRAANPSAAVFDRAANPGAVVSFSAAPIAALALPRKIDAGRDLVVLTSGQAAPTLIAVAADAVASVTTVADEDDAGACPTTSTLTSGAGADGVLSLREAVCEANNSGAASSVIYVPPGTYTLSISTAGGSGSVFESGELQVGNSAGATIAIVGTGTPANTLISQANGVDRVLEQDQPLAGSVAVSIANLTLSGGTPTSGLDAEFGGGAILGGGNAGDDLMLSGVVVSNNTTAASAAGGAVNFSFANLAVAGSIFSGNTAAQSAGGACGCETAAGQGSLAFTNSTFIGNIVTDASTLSPPGIDLGGALQLTAGLGSAATISGSGFTANQAQGALGVGGAIAADGAITLSNSRLVGNAAAAGSGFGSGSDPQSVATLVDNWWGCNAGPNNAGCDSVFIDTADGASGAFNPWLVLGISASPGQVLPAGSSMLTAGLSVDSDGNGGFSVPDGTTVAFGATLGTANPTSAATLSGTATSTFTAGAMTGAGAATATVDSQTVSVSINIGQPPAITSANNTTFTAGTAGLFSVTTSGSPNPSLSASGSLPAGISFLDNGNGTGTLAGTPGPGSGGVYPISFTAQNGAAPSATQSFTLTVNQAPVITSAGSTSFTLGAAGSFTLTTSAFPTSVLTEAGSLPGGVGFVDNQNGTGTLSGTPTVGGVFPITFSAANGIGSPAVQSFTLTLNQATTVTSLSGSPSPSTYGQPVTFTATVAAASGTPTGTVTFKNGTVKLAVVALANGSAAYTTSALLGGSHAMTAAYSGSAIYSPSSGAATQTVNKAAAALVMTGAPNPSAYGQPVTFSATVSAASGTPTGTVAFKNGSAYLGVVTLANGSATLTTAALLAGQHTISAAYSGSGNNLAGASATVTQTVNAAATTVVTTASSNPSAYGQPVTFTATVSAAAGAPMPTGTVAFSNGTAKLAAVALSNGSATFTTAALLAGTHTITAAYGGSANTLASASAVTQTVNKAAVTVVADASPNPSAYGQPVTITATVSAASGTPTPTGTVTFKNGNAYLGVVPLANGAASLTTAALLTGPRAISAAYNGAGNYLAGSSTVTETVNGAATASVASASPNPSAYGQPVTLTATVSAASGTPTGTVTFKTGSRVLGNATLAGGVAALTTSTLGVGTLPITAVYQGAAAFAGSTSSALSQTVVPATSSLTLTASPNPSAFGQTVILTATVALQFGATPTGQVAFGIGGTVVGNVPLADGAATFAASSLPSGTVGMTAKYAGNTNFSGSQATLTQTVNPVLTPSYTLTAGTLNPSFVTSGNTATSLVQVTPVNGYAGGVNLSCTVNGGADSAPTCSVSPASMAVGGATPATTTLTVLTSNGTPSGNYSIVVSAGDANNLAPSNGAQALALTTVPAGTPGYGLSPGALSPASVTAGNPSTSTLQVTPLNGYGGTVNLSCSVSGGGGAAPSCSVSPSLVTLSGASPSPATLTVSTSTGTPGGSTTISVSGSDANQAAPVNGPQTLTLATAGAIQHVVIIVQENRTPDNLFQDPVLIAAGADIASSGVNSQGQSIALTPIDLGTAGANPQNFDLAHTHVAFTNMYDGGKMDGADRIGCGPPAQCPPNAHPNPQFMYVSPADVQPYFAMAEQYTFGDRMFETNQGPSLPAHQFILSGTSAPTASSPLFAAENPAIHDPTGCLGALTNTVAMIDASGSETDQPPEYPCFEHPTLPDQLASNGMTWRYYTPSASNFWTAPVAIQHLCQPQTVNGNLTCTNPEFTGNVVVPPTQVLTDIANGNLAQVSWVIPVGYSSDHALGNEGSGPSWVASVVNAIGNSPYWANTAIIVTWDDWGGWYDHVAPKVINDGISWGSGYAYGFRVPLIVISPYAKAAYISHVTHDFGSILKFIETNFNLPSLGYADAPADDLSDCFNLTQTPLPFMTIAAPYGAAHFLNDKRPPTAPDDD